VSPSTPKSTIQLYSQPKSKKKAIYITSLVIFRVYKLFSPGFSHILAELRPFLLLLVFSADRISQRGGIGR
jgi:hypothetical protein